MRVHNNFLSIAMKESTKNIASAPLLTIRRPSISKKLWKLKRSTLFGPDLLSPSKPVEKANPKPNTARITVEEPPILASKSSPSDAELFEIATQLSLTNNNLHMLKQIFEAHTDIKQKDANPWDFRSFNNLSYWVKVHLLFQLNISLRLS